MFAVDGWSLPNVVAQKSEKKRKADPDASAAKVTKKPKSNVNRSKDAGPASTTKKVTKDKSKYLPYSKDKGNSGANIVPVAKERKPRPKSPSPAPPAPETGKKSFDQNKRPAKKPLARPPRSEREKTPPKLVAEEPPPMFTGLSNNKNLTPLQQKMAAKLSGARFRWINERLYTTTGADALKLISDKPDMFEEYHAGFRSQVKDWPSNPIDIYKGRLENLLADEKTPRGQKKVVADLGCGEAMIAQRILELDPNSRKIEVKSYDLRAANERITACDIADLPLKDNSVDVAIFCLSLMGTDFLKFIHEAFRVLKPAGDLWISEIKSRFNDKDAKAFIDALKKMGFALKARDDSNKMFINLDFVRGKDRKRGPELDNVGTKKIGTLLKPCTYKKR